MKQDFNAIDKELDKLEKGVAKRKEEYLALRENHFQDIGEIHRELGALDKKKHPYSLNLKQLDAVIEFDFSNQNNPVRYKDRDIGETITKKD